MAGEDMAAASSYGAVNRHEVEEEGGAMRGEHEGLIIR